MKHEKEAQLLSEALKNLISVIIHEESQIPDRMVLGIRTEHLEINATINLDIGLTEKGKKEFREQFGSAVPFKMFVRPEDLNNGK